MDEVREEIIRVAHDFYLKSGCQQGHDLDNWLAAEELVRTWHLSFDEREKHVGTLDFPENKPALELAPDEVVN